MCKCALPGQDKIVRRGRLLLLIHHIKDHGACHIVIQFLTVHSHSITSVPPNSWFTFSAKTELCQNLVPIMSLTCCLFLLAPILFVAGTPRQGDRTQLSSVSLKQWPSQENLRSRVSVFDKNKVTFMLKSRILLIYWNHHHSFVFSFLQQLIGTPRRHWI